MKNQSKGINTFQRYLSVWVLLCMAIGVLIGHFVPAIPATLGKFQISGISIPIAILIWVMIYPMMMKVDFQSIKQIGMNPKGLLVTWATNWLIKPFTMYGIAYLFLFVVFKAFISPGLATEYLAGAVLLGAAPCTAMVFVWSTLTKGNPAYTVVQVATNDLIILVAFVPIVKFLLGVSNVAVPYSTLFVSIFLFVVIPLVGGILTRVTVVKHRGADYFESMFIHKFDNATTIGLLLTLVIIFSSQAEVILSNPLHIVLIAVPLTIQVGDLHIVDDESFNQAAFLKAVAACPEPAKTACPSPDKYREAFDDPQADHVYAVTLSGALSGSYNSALLGREITLEEVKDFAECGLCGTAAVISPVRAINDHGKEIVFPGSADGNVGPTIKKLYDTLTGIQMCKIEAPEGWVHVIK